MALRGRRFRHRQYRRAGGRLHPWAIVGICLAAAVIVTVVIGNLLKLWLDDETFLRLTVGDETEAPKREPISVDVRDVNAYPFVLGNELEGILGKTAVSVTLNSPDGKMQYKSDLADHLGFSNANNVSFDETMPPLCGFVPYVSGVFYSQAFLCESETLRFAVTGDECAVLREFLRAGGGEIVIVGLPLTLAEMESVLFYLESVKFAAGNAPVGVAVPMSVAASADGWRVISELLTVCDFCALDVSNEPTLENDVNEFGVSASAEALIASAEYYVSGYGMRLFLSERQEQLLSTLERKIYPNFQVFTHLDTALNEDVSTENEPKG